MAHSSTYTDESHRYARREDWDCLMWARDEIPEVQENWRGPGGWRQTAGGEPSYASTERIKLAHDILLRHARVVRTR